MYRPRNEPDGYVNPSFIFGTDTCVAGIVEEVDGRVVDNEIYVNDGIPRPESERRFTISFLKKYMYVFLCICLSTCTFQSQ